MKISKTAVLIGGFLTTGLGLMCVSGLNLYNLNLNTSDNPNRLVQHIFGVKIIESGNDVKGIINYDENLVYIDTNNFVLSKDEKSNIIITGNHSSILGGSGNTITGDYDVILGGENNKIENGTYNSILGGMENKLETGENSVIVGGEYNTLQGSNSSIVGGTGNIVNGDYSVVVGNNSHVMGNNSVVMGQNSNLNANSSFLWTDGGHADSFTTDNVFAVIASGGMVINAIRPHNDYTQLTLGGPLVLSENTGENNSIICSNGEGGGIVKVVNSGDKVCMCSCDGYERSSLFGLGTCRSICNPDIKPKCGTGMSKISKHWDTTGQYNYYSGGCDSGNVVGGAYFVDKYNVVHWSCQSDDGAVIECTGSNVIGTGYEGCGGEKPEGEHIIHGSSTGVSNNKRKQWMYVEKSDDLGVCEWSCKSGYEWDDNKCVEEKSSCGVGKGMPLIPKTKGVVTGASTYKGNDYSPKVWTYTGRTEFNKLKNNACYWSCREGKFIQKMGCVRGGIVNNGCSGELPDHAEVNDPEKKPDREYTGYFYQDLIGDGTDNAPCSFHCLENYKYNSDNDKCEQYKFECTGKPGTGKYVVPGPSTYEVNDGIIPSTTKRTYTGGKSPASCEWTCLSGSIRVSNIILGEDTCELVVPIGPKPDDPKPDDPEPDPIPECIGKDKIPKYPNEAIPNNNTPPTTQTQYYYSVNREEPCTYRCPDNTKHEVNENGERCLDRHDDICNNATLGCNYDYMDSDLTSEYNSKKRVIEYKWKCRYNEYTEPTYCTRSEPLKCTHCAINGFSYCFPIDFGANCDEVKWWEAYNLNIN